MAEGGPVHPESLQIPVANCFSSEATKCVLLAFPACPSPVPLGLGKGGMVGKARDASAGSPQGCRLGWVRFLYVGGPGDGNHQETAAAFCINPVFCKSLALHLQKHMQPGGGWVQAAVAGSRVLPCGSHRWGGV